ncbi:MAG: type II toxin-antitoxin system RelE/ParE family toxin [Bergeyella sp.]
MKYQLLISEEAFWDIEDAVEYYSEISENLENRFLKQLKEGLSRITKYPLHYALKYKQIRICNFKNFPYQIHFSVEENRILVFGIFHGRSNPKSWEERL